MREPSAEQSKATTFGAARTFSSLRYPNFRLLWVTSLLNAGSNWIQQVTLGWLAYDLSGSALTAGIVFGARSLPSLIIGPIGGVLGDRFERRRGLQINSGYMAALALGFAALLTFGEVHVWHLIVFTMLQGLGQALVNPVRQAIVANTVPADDLMNAIALNALAFNVMRVLGPALAGVLIALFGPALNFGLQSGAYLIVFLLVLPLKTPYTNLRAGRHHASIRESFTGGLSYVAQNPTVLGLILLALVPPLFTTPINLGLLPVFAREVLKTDSTGLGLLYSAQGVGAVIGTLTLASLGNYRRPGLVIAGTGIALSISIFMYAQMTVFVAALLLLAVGTCCFMTFMTSIQTMIQMITPDEYRARVMGLQMMDHGLAPLGSLLFGTIAEFYGVPTAMIVAGCCAMTVVLFILARFPSIRAFENKLHVPDPPRQAVAPSAEAPARAPDGVAVATTAPD